MCIRDSSRDGAMTLASIVYEETKRKDEMPVVAGVYINRLKRGMPLQADPTVKFAVGDFSIKRVLHTHLAVDSPYNTYKYPGLPSGPICMPSILSLIHIFRAGREVVPAVVDILFFVHVWCCVPCLKNSPDRV